MSKYTPGPWVEGQDGNPRVYGPDNAGNDSGLIAVVYKGRGNVHLIAAAPDLLHDATQTDNALTWLAEQMNSITDNAKYWNVGQIEALVQDLRIGIERNQKRVRAVIAKAEGK